MRVYHMGAPPARHLHLEAEAWPAPPAPAVGADEILQRDTEARLRVIQNILDQHDRGAATWREAAARIRAIADRLPREI